ncbi:MAG: response regulator [Bacteroidetes bacterium]|nr:response regulator [Bacteroidota bacterium]
MGDLNKFLTFLVDDDSMMLTAYQQHMGNEFGENFEAMAFQTGEACIEKLYLKPDVIFLDYYLDGVDPEAENGLKTLEKIKVENSEIRVIMLSGQDGFGTAAQTLLKGAEDYIIKDANAMAKAENMIKDMMQEKVDNAI